MKKSTKNISLEKKLSAYSLAAAAVIGIQPAAAQIVYTDVNPDVTLSGANANYDLDLDNNGTPDMQIQLTIGASSQSVRIFQSLANEVLGSPGGQYFYPFAMNVNDPINDQGNMWNGTINGGYLTMAWKYLTGGSYGNWFGATDKYLGIRIFVGGAYHYGWARCDVGANGESFTIKDYAYEQTAGAGILAGDDGVVGMNELTPEDMNIFTNQDMLVVDLQKNAINGHVEIMNLAGQVIKNVEVTDSRMEINISELSQGFYVVAVRTENSVVTKRIFRN